jgi:hypothetical protein
MKIIPLQDCKDRYLYKINSRNFNLGVFDAENRDFIGIRHKCGETFLDRENHTLGCVKVLDEIEKIPENIKLNTGHFSETELSVLGDRLWIENSDLFNYLENK